MSLTDVFHRIEIETPDGPSALALEHRLAHLSPTTIERDGRWLVEIDGVDALDEIEGGVARWLRDIGEASTTMKIDGRAIAIDSHARGPVAERSPGHTRLCSNRNFIG